ncbi:UdgX family uracil-DNA binding protein [Thalassorhabdomicrobium marinisediminis]|uniref:Type-4 uracil-DNA glycosylase n=1 Tax=Thalassorhabdomicrobium marinisediminis TaxID=2170577 RepID=A0A2T7G1B6_9RHOB|nr:UdgX family uracil-DNA binding protein [Thalassorhabdomicrobium marinisediminis]PVA08197.1 uracil-DNA glycosylase [Thalassorhabdomicrobium marinisediminis]
MSHRITLPRIGTAQAWRDAARGLLGAGVPPADIAWGDEDAPAGLFDAAPAPPASGAITVPRSFLSLAQSVVWHSDPARFALLYRVLWRSQDAPHLMTDRADADLAALRRMEKNVHRCQHKMKAFVRFRDLGSASDARRSFVAWFEPTHHTVEPTAPFFARRFGDMDWRILTPDVSASFIGGELTFHEGQEKPPLPEDASEELWTTYFRNIFNPARLKVKAMQSEMPKKYWKNMPEAAAIPELIASAPARVRAMNEAAPTLPPLRAGKVEKQLAAFGSRWSGSRDELSAQISACTRCPLYCMATQAVPGEGPSQAALMIVGEQPGDQEDLQGRPFVGPAGQLFDRLAGEVDFARTTAFVTNAVKHFKFKPQGRRRLHQRPNTSEIDQCKWWLDAERATVQPKVILAMGATAATALTGDGRGIGTRRGRVSTLEDGTALILTYHPSYMLRLRDTDQRAQAEEAFRQDLALAHRLSRSISTERPVEEDGAPMRRAH